MKRERKEGKKEGSTCTNLNNPGSSNQNQILTNLNTEDFKLLFCRFAAFSLFSFQLFCFYWPFLAFFPFGGLKRFSRNLMGEKNPKEWKEAIWSFLPICRHLSLGIVILPPHPIPLPTLLFLPNAPFVQNLPLMFLKVPFPLCSSSFDKGWTLGFPSMRSNLEQYMNGRWSYRDLS